MLFPSRVSALPGEAQTSTPMAQLLPEDILRKAAFSKLQAFMFIIFAILKSCLYIVIIDLVFLFETTYSLKKIKPIFHHLTITQ